MPASQRSLSVTDAYRARMVALREQAQRSAADAWRQTEFEALDDTFAVVSLAEVVAALQQQAVRASGGYVAAFLSSEYAQRIPGPALDPEPYVGLTRDGQPLSGALTAPLITVKTAIKNGQTDPMELGRARLLRIVGLATDTAARSALADAMHTDERIKGWRRAVRGTCGACLGAATGTTADTAESMDIHPGCQCVTEPVVANVRERVRRLSGPELFAAMAATQQDEILGPEKAELVRTGAVELADLIDHSPMKREDDLLTERPLEALT